MAFDAITNSQVDTDSPADTTLLNNLKNRDDWNESGNSSGNAAFFVAAYNSGHSHDGTSGEGAQIPTAGIADGGVNQTNHFADDAVDNSALAATTLGTTKFQDGAVTPAKMSGTMGNSTRFTGSGTSPTNQTVAHGLGRRPVVCNIGSPEFIIISTDSTNVVVGPNNNVVGPTDPYDYAFDCC